MKKVLSISLGSSERDHRVETEIAGESFLIERRGTDGDKQKAAHLFSQLDGKYDAFGLGGMDLFVFSGNNKYRIRETSKLISGAKKTPVVDGSGLKDTLERNIIHQLDQSEIINFNDKKVLVVSVLDRFGMAETLSQVGADIRAGDFLFVLGFPLVLNSLGPLSFLARIIAPLVVRLPLDLLYPLGEKQEQRIIKKKYTKHMMRAEIIAGDFHFIKRYSPSQLSGKVIITNTVTDSDVSRLQKQGVQYLITTTPELEGRSFGTNVIEALLVAMSEKEQVPLSSSEYFKLINYFDFQPRIEKLN